MWKTLSIINLLHYIVNAEVYNTYHAVPATKEEITAFEEKNIASICTVSFNPCNMSELRRPDGSCNNLNHPSTGMVHTPHSRLLPPDYGENFEPRLMSNGEPYLPARKIRQTLVKTGDGINEHLSTAGSYFFEFVSADIATILDTRNYVFQTTWCCDPEGLDDYMCTPNKILADDNVHRFSHIRCNNNTRPISFQTTGCVSNNTVPARINHATTFFDLSMTYSFLDVNLQDTREFEGGRLKVEVVNGQIYPSDANKTTTCTIEVAAKTGCTRKVPNSLPGSNLFITWFWRMHNLIADGLFAENPCWEDERIFRTAMDINIAYYTHILFYEYFALILGRKNLIKEGILQPVSGFRDTYDENVLPELLMEFAYGMRWFHGTQDTKQKMYDKNFNHVKTRSMVNLSLLVQILPYDDLMPQITRGLFMQDSAAYDDTVDPDMAEIALGQYQEAFDVMTADLAKGRYLGLNSYLDYRDLCTNYTICHQSFDDLTYLMKKSKIELLKKVYPTAKDIELMAGAWSENLMKGAWVPPTIYCMLVAQLKRTVASDRFWYERPNRPNAFTKEQMAQITQSSLAGLFCSVGDGVTEVQPKAFRTIGPGNKRVSCDQIPQLDMSVWKDSSCDNA